MEVGILIGFWGFVWVRCLCAAGEAFDFLPTWLMPLAQAGSLGEDWGEKVYKAAVGCPKCHAGQVAFWSAFIAERSLETSFGVFVVAIVVAHFLDLAHNKMA